MKYPRVKAAFDEKLDKVKAMFKKKGLEYPPREIFFRAFKKELALELWARPGQSGPFKLITTFKIDNLPGHPGPKRMEGDRQVPEGFYHIDRFNPESRRLLSLGVSYPNKSDKILGVKDNLGGDIFIHGHTTTIGCLPMTDELIKEIYIIAVEARNLGQKKIPIHIFPRRLDQRGLEELGNEFGEDKDLIEFWKDLKKGYDYFEQTRELPEVIINNDGRYLTRDVQK